MGPLWVAKKPPDLHPLFPERGKPVESLGARGRSPRPTPCTVTPSSVQRERESGRALYQKEEELGPLVLDRTGEGGCRGGSGLCWG